MNWALILGDGHVELASPPPMVISVIAPPPSSTPFELVVPQGIRELVEYQCLGSRDGPIFQIAHITVYFDRQVKCLHRLNNRCR